MCVFQSIFALCVQYEFGLCWTVGGFTSVACVNLVICHIAWTSAGPCGMPERVHELVCFVALVFQPGEEFDVVPGSHFVVSRTAYRDNSSSYHVNGKKVSFKEVTALLRQSGIDLDHNRFLILQVSCRCY